MPYTVLVQYLIGQNGLRMVQCGGYVSMLLIDFPFPIQSAIRSLGVVAYVMWVLEPRAGVL